MRSTSVSRGAGKLVRRGLALAFCGLALLAWPLRLGRRVTGRRGLSIWTGAPILTLPLKALAERSLGADARSLALITYRITDAFDYNLAPWRRLPAVRTLVPYLAFLWACVRADRIHAFCDGALLPAQAHLGFNMLELATYRLLGIQVFLWAYGADVRSRNATLALGAPNCCTDCTLVKIACICDEARRRDKMRELTARATAVFSMGDMVEYTPGSRNDLFYWPVDIERNPEGRYTPAYPEVAGRRSVRVVHAPNHRMFKGTRFLEAAVSALRSEGLRVDLVIVEHMSNADALAVFRTADIIFDQCLTGFHGYFALEGMALGKPVMCFIRKRDYLLAPDECPILNTSIATLKEDLRRLVAQPKLLAEIGRQGRRYVEKYYTVSAFAARLARAYGELGVRP